MERWEGDSVLSIGKKRKSFHIVPGWHRVQLRTPYHNRSPRLFGWVRGYRNKISGNDFYGNLPCDLSRGTRIYIHIHSPLQTGVVVQPPRPISNSKKKERKKQLPLERIRLFSMSSSCSPPFPSVYVYNNNVQQQQPRHTGPGYEKRNKTRRLCQVG